MGVVVPPPPDPRSGAEAERRGTSSANSNSELSTSERAPVVNVASTATATPTSPSAWPPRVRSLPTSMALAAAGASCACLVTNPIEVVKTRMQLQGELQSRHTDYTKPYRNVAQGLAHIFRHEGVRGLQSGLVPGIAYQVAMNGVRLGSYASFQRAFGAGDPQVDFFFLRNVCAGAACGAWGAAVGSPFFMVKVRLQAAVASSSSDRAAVHVGYQHNYRGVVHGLADVLRKEGIRGWFRGSSGNVMCGAL